MAIMALARVVLVTLLCAGAWADEDKKYQIPEVKIQVFSPKGFRATIPDAPGIVHFLVQGQLKRAGSTQKEDFYGGETASFIELDGNKVWVVDLPDVELKKDDKIEYLAFVAVNNDGYVKDSLTYVVNELESNYVPLLKPNYIYEEEATTVEAPTVQGTTEEETQQWQSTTEPCPPSETRVHHQGSVCAEETIFEENFDTLRRDVWQIQHYIPLDHPEAPFVSYQRSAVSVSNGLLYISASTQLNDTSASMYTPLDLSDGCTSGESRQCSQDGQEPVPPIISGRITSKLGFAFQYGTVTIKAKLPKGDWIYPEILLEPFLKKFGVDSRNTGIVKIASARGNANLNKKLYGGPVLDTRCHDSLLATKESENLWSEDFHEYSIKWTPENLVLSVDGEVYATVEPAADGLRGKLPDNCSGVQAAGIAPFDEYFYLTLGLAVGGDTEFPNSENKPWKNGRRKAPLKFWTDTHWKCTWKQPELVVDYVKVVAL